MKKYLRFDKSSFTLNSRFLLMLILFLAVFLRIYQLDVLPGEMWGDVVEGYKFTKEILEGKWPFYFVLGNGPLFYYFGLPSFLLFGVSFLTLKFVAVFYGLVLILGTYIMTKYIFNERVALLCAFLIAVSKWPLIFSRLGTMNILVPVFIAFIFYFFFRIIRKEDLHSFLFLSVLTGVGLYNYPSFIFVPVSLTILFIYIFIIDRSFLTRNLYKIIISVLIFICISIPFISKLPQFGITDKNSYFGSKLFAGTGSRTESLSKQLAINTVHSLSMFQIRGDEVFRVNVKNQPHLDILSGIFLLMGIIFLIRDKYYRKYALLLIIPFLTLQLPAILVLNFPGEIPSATRSIGTLPFLYIIVALGIYFPLIKLRGFHSLVFLIVVLTVITVLNVKHVFIDYAQGLPNKNTPFGKIIAQRIDNRPLYNPVYLLGCCWGEWGHPDSDNIRYVLRDRRDIITDLLQVYENDKSCYSLETLIKGGEGAYIIVDPRSDYVKNKIKECYPRGSEETIYENGFIVAWVYKIAH